MPTFLEEIKYYDASGTLRTVGDIELPHLYLQTIQLKLYQYPIDDPQNLLATTVGTWVSGLLYFNFMATDLYTFNGTASVSTNYTSLFNYLGAHVKSLNSSSVVNSYIIFPAMPYNSTSTSQLLQTSKNHTVSASTFVPSGAKSMASLKLWCKDLAVGTDFPIILTSSYMSSDTNGTVQVVSCQYTQLF